ncbi:MAG TPA: iron-sulfur cluster-binding domain-containing protein [Polyangiaceae bacterium]|nr:iron-sulfur cluster-binding domain-containing protein [Polyangiaceae bacterium]
MLALTLQGIGSFNREINGLKKIPRRLLRPGLGQATSLLDRATSRVRADVPVLETLLSRLDPKLSLHRILARVVEVREETHDVKTFVLSPNARFGTFRPGAYVMVGVTVAGRVVQRAYSLSSAPGDDGRISITVKRVPGGVVSNHLADEIRAGDVLEIGAPAGQFLLGSEAPRLLMISAGSGVTPVMSMLRDLVRRGSPSKITFLHFARTPADVIFGRELAAIAERMANVEVVLCVEEADSSWTGLRGRFSPELLAAAAPDFAGAETYLCGPPGFMRVVMQTLEQSGADLSKLRYERFSSEFDASTFLTEARVLRFTRSGVESLSNRALTVLQEAEARGVRVDTGCRAGTCGTCRCKKRKGVVLNTATGALSGEGEEMIYPCVSVAQGALEVDL